MSEWRSICRIWSLYLSNHAEIIWNHSKPYSIKVPCHYGSFLECSCCRRCAAHEAHLDEPWKHGPWKAWWLHVAGLNGRTLIIHWGCTSAFHDVSMLHKLHEGLWETEAEMDDNGNWWLFCKSWTLCTCLFFPKLEGATTYHTAFDIDDAYEQGLSEPLHLASWSAVLITSITHDALIMLRADEAFELMQQRAREAQERGWHVPRDLDGQSLQQKYPQDLQLGYSE